VIGLKNLSLLRSAQRILRNLPAPSKPCLVWGDLAPQNILVAPDGRLRCLLDFEGVLSAEAALQHGYVQSRFAGSPFGIAYERFLRTNSKQMDITRGAVYSVLRGLLLARYSGQPLPSGRQRDNLNNVLPGFGAALRLLARELQHETSRGTRWKE
jgi:aminoglycoside phosphotransferase (APT) family kinase protein